MLMTAAVRSAARGEIIRTKAKPAGPSVTEKRDGCNIDDMRRKNKSVGGYATFKARNTLYRNSK